jgi:hypothetical protein
MTDLRRQRYAIAGAMAVTVADLLRDVHSAADGAVDADVAAAVARAHGSAAACSAVAARLLLSERDAARAQFGIANSPPRAELGVTVLEGSSRASWAATVRAVAAAGTELVATKACWDAWDGEAGRPVQAALVSLMGYVEALAGLLETHAPVVAEPPEPGG